MLAVNADRKGSEYVSAAEALSYPIYGLQWHPEKVTAACLHTGITSYVFFWGGGHFIEISVIRAFFRAISLRFPGLFPSKRVCLETSGSNTKLTT